MVLVKIQTLDNFCFAGSTWSYSKLCAQELLLTVHRDVRDRTHAREMLSLLLFRPQTLEFLKTDNLSLILDSKMTAEYQVQCLFHMATRFTLLSKVRGLLLPLHSEITPGRTQGPYGISRIDPESATFKTRFLPAILSFQPPTSEWHFSAYD